MTFSSTRALTLGTLIVATALAGCTTTSTSRAPVEDRSAQGNGTRPPVDPSTLPGYENMGKPGYYTVRKGDTIMRIALEAGQYWRDIIAWNNLSDPNVIEVGQVLRVVPPVGSAPTAVAAAPASARTTPATAPNAAAVVPPSAAPATGAPARTEAPSAAGADDISFAWPANGSILGRFDEARNKGIDIAGKAGDAVLAAADGRVVYAGSGLRGYGQLIILKHNNTYLTAYAHNQALLVKEDQSVKRGQKIAEMGSSDTDRVKLHFEVRRQGKPVDPMRHLPAR